MDKNLKMLQKGIIGCIAIYIPILLLFLLVTLLFSSTVAKFDKFIVFGIILPFLLFIVLGIALFAKKFMSVQKDFVTSNFSIIEEVLGRSVHYQENGGLPFHIVSEDPTISAMLANSCNCSHVITGKYRNVDFLATNIVTKNVRGYREMDYPIFEGFYILLNIDLRKFAPIYICSQPHWNDHNAHGPLSFVVNKNNLPESKKLVSNQYRVYANHEIASTSIFDNPEFKVFLDGLFDNINYDISLYIYSNGKLGLAVREFKVFQFSELKIFNIDEKDIAPEETRKIIYNDALKIREYLEHVIKIRQFI